MFFMPTPAGHGIIWAKISVQQNKWCRDNLIFYIDSQLVVVLISIYGGEN